MNREESAPCYQEPQIIVVGTASEIMKNSINGYYYDAGGSNYVPYQ